MKKEHVILLGFLVCFGLFSLVWLREKPNPITYINPLDYQFKPIFKPSKPDTIIQWLKPDTVLRKEIVEGDVVVKVETRERWLGVQTIDTKGIIHEEKYKLPHFAEFQVDTAGNVKIKRKILPRIIIGASVAAVGIFTYFAIKKSLK